MPIANRLVTWTTGCNALIVLVMTACTTERSIPVDPNLRELMPDPDPPTSESVCISGGDDFPPPASWVIDCKDLAPGFAYETIRVSLSDAGAFLPDNPRVVYFVHMVRWSDLGRGYRLLAAEILPAEPYGVELLPMDVPLLALDGIDGFSLVGFIGGCPAGPTYADPMVCAKYAFEFFDSHDEPVLCVWNSGDPSYGSAALFCDSGPFTPGGNNNKLPVAHIDEASYVDCSQGDFVRRCWTLNGSSSTDPEGGALTYHWSVFGETVTTQSPIAQLTGGYFEPVCAPGGCGWGIRLRVTDLEGGIDVVGQ